MTELNRGEFVVNADGSVIGRGKHGGRPFIDLPTDWHNDYGHATIEDFALHMEGFGYTRVYPDAPATIGPFGSGASLKTDGSHITGRIEPEAGDYPDSWESLLNSPPGKIVQVRKPVPYTVRCEPAVMPTNRLMTSEDLIASIQAAHDALRAQDTPAEPKRAPLPHFNQRTEFDPFPGFKVRSDTGWMTGEDGHPLQRMTADSPTHGSAHLLAKP